MKTKHKNLAIKTVLILIALCLPSGIIVQNSFAQSTQTADKYCAQYKETKKVACHDGWKGTECSNYLYSHNDQELVDICTKAAGAKTEAEKNGTNTGNNNNDTDNKGDDKTDTGSGNTNSSNSGKKDTLQQMIDQLKELQGEDKDGKDPDKIPDNNYGQYVNGRGDLQPLHVNKKEGTNQPAIIFVNGGGWHTDDGTGQKIAPKAVERGYATFVATYRLGSSGIYYMYEDIMRAVRHVRNNASMYGIDPNRIAIWGDSAGGSLALRVSSSGKSGVAAAVGWSTPTNAYTALFRSVESFAIGMDHSTCMPTDINGVANVIDQLNGGEGNIENDGGLGNNGTAGTDTALGTVTQVLELAQTAQQAGKNVKSLVGEESEDGGSGGSGSEGSSEGGSGGGKLEQNVRRLATKKLIECLDNFNSASPALLSSPLSPPTFLAGYDNDPRVAPEQAYQMRDRLRSQGIPSKVLILPGVQSSNVVPGENHLDYNEKFVAPSLNFLDKFLHPPNAPEQTGDY